MSLYDTGGAVTGFWVALGVMAAFIVVGFLLKVF